MFLFFCNKDIFSNINNKYKDLISNIQDTLANSADNKENMDHKSSKNLPLEDTKKATESEENLKNQVIIPPEEDNKKNLINDWPYDFQDIIYEKDFLEKELKKCEKPSMNNIVLPDELIECIILYICEKDKISLKNYISKNNTPINREIYRFIRNPYLSIPNALKDIPVIIVAKIEYLTESNSIFLAAQFMIKKYKILLSNKNEKLLTRILREQKFIIKKIIFEKEFQLLYILIHLNFLPPNHAMVFSEHMTKACAAIIIGQYAFAINLLEKVYKDAKTFRKKAQSAYIIGSVYFYFYRMNHNKKNLEISNKWFNLAIAGPQCLWTFLAMIMLKKTPKLYSIQAPPTKQFTSPKDRTVERAVAAFKRGDKLKAIKEIFGLEYIDYDNFSTSLKEALIFFLSQKDRVLAYRIGYILFLKTGKIIKECFEFIPEIKTLIDNKEMTAEEGMVLMGIINIESKFYNHSYFSLDTDALGICQIQKTEINNVRKILKIKEKFNKYEFLKNISLQLKYAQAIFKSYERYVDNDLIFKINFYNQGSTACKYKKSMAFLNLNDPLFRAVILINLPGSVRRYIINVLEFSNLVSLTYNNKLINI
jgi:hypothetical protein